ncbi:MAG: response regulator [Labilithrix sp.]|nr:response regulator [Labilithrix sp.]
MGTEDKDLSRRLTLAVLAPVALLVALGGVLGVQLLRTSEDARWLDHSDRVLSRVYQLQKHFVDEETAIRGYLITSDARFLEPYYKARPVELLDQLTAVVDDNPDQLRRVEELRRRHESWQLDAAAVAEGKNLDEARSIPAMLRRREKMNSLREIVTQIVDDEHAIRDRRAAASERSTATTRTLFVVMFLGAAGFLAFFSRRQLTAITGTYASALAGERGVRATLEDEAWTRAGQAKLAEAVQGELSVEEVGDRVLTSLASYTDAEVGAFFDASGGVLRRRAGFALDPRAGGADAFGRGEGLVGRAAEGHDVLRVQDLAEHDEAPKLRAGTRERPTGELFLIPLRIGGRAYGVVELGYREAPPARATDLLGRIGEGVAVAVRSAEYRTRLRELLEESQRQAEELQTQQEELRVANEELEEQSKAVREAQARLEERQEELTTANSRLEEQAHDLESARESALEKADALERASRYKSEFLANMSHELRTPLNSSLILAKLLGDNKDGNLTAEQVKYAHTIYGAGNDLLTLINDILDLSKIEAGKIDVTFTEVPVARIAGTLVRLFEPVATDKGLRFAVVVEPGTPEHLVTDQQRIEQVLKNLCSNALKFTETGEVEVHISPGPRSVRFAVRDTGIGIAPHQHELVFEAFRQADGASNRKYGGTGLGLSISRDLARLLGGDITVSSEVGKGSTFVLTLPRARPAAATSPDAPRTLAPATPIKPAPRTPPAPVRRVSGSVAPAARAGARLVEDDRDALDARRRVVLVIEDDPRFAEILLQLAHERDFQCVVAGEADEGLTLATELLPSAIVLDINLPDHSGLSVLDRLKRTPATRHIPVHVVTVADHPQTVLSMGAAAYLQKPVKREELLDAFKQLEDRLARGVRRLLVVEDDPVQRDSLAKLLATESVELVAVGTVREALEAQAHGVFDCIVTDLTLPDDSGFHLLEQMSRAEGPHPPVIVYTGRSLSSDEEHLLRKYSSSIIVKGARSPERLLDEVTLFLHQVESKLPIDRQKMLKQARDREAVLDGRTILVVEDDVRNIFALSSVLEPRGAVVVVARNGHEALAALEKNAAVELVLMDIMMPEMDGLTAMREIRKRPQHAKLPIIALTAKAMKDDQERCLKAGANDYISKPLDVEMLLSLLRVWMPR